MLRWSSSGTPVRSRNFFDTPVCDWLAAEIAGSIREKARITGRGGENSSTKANAASFIPKTSVDLIALNTARMVTWFLGPEHWVFGMRSELRHGLEGGFSLVAWIWSS
jgi:hypothetical protein